MQFVLEFKIASAPEDAPDTYMDTINAKKKTIKMNFMPMHDFGLDGVLEYIQAYGFDLNKFDEADLEYKDIKNALNEIEDAVAKVNINVVPKPDGGQYPYNYYFNELDKVVKIRDEVTTPDTSAPTPPPSAPTDAPTPPAPKAPEAKVTSDGFTLAQLIENGWSEEQALATYPELN